MLYSFTARSPCVFQVSAQLVYLPAGMSGLQPATGPAGQQPPADSSAGFKEPEDRYHSPVLGFALRQVELGQDAADVLLHRALGDEYPAGDASVRRALGH